MYAIVPWLMYGPYINHGTIVPTGITCKKFLFKNPKKYWLLEYVAKSYVGQSAFHLTVSNKFLG